MPAKSYPDIWPQCNHESADDAGFIIKHLQMIHYTILNAIKKARLIRKLTLNRYYKEKQLEGKTVRYNINNKVVSISGPSLFPLIDEIVVADSYHLKRQPAPAVIIDIGANMGIFSVHAATLFPDCRIFAIEPSLQNFKLLKANTAQFPNVHCFHMAVSGYDGIGYVTDEPDNTWHRVRSHEIAPGGEQCETITFNSFMSRNQISSIDMLKLDCEGAEYDIFNGNLKPVKQIVGEYHIIDAKGPEELQQQLVQQNFYIREWSQFSSQRIKEAGHFWAISNDVA